MNKEKFEKAVKRICYLSILKNYESNENADYIYREIVKSARELIAAAGDDIAEKSTPAESSPENKGYGYLPNTYFANNGIEYTD